MEPSSLDFCLRILAALILGFLLGLERELTNKYAGLRTHILVCLGACVFTILSIHGFPTFAEGDNVVVSQATGLRDTGRVAAQIVTGIGFIGAGTVLRNGPIIIGLTTAATLWISAAIGMTCGVGMYDIAVLTTLASVAVLTIIRVFERKFIPTSTKCAKRYKVILYTKIEAAASIRNLLIDISAKLEDFTLKRLNDEPDRIRISAIFELSGKKVCEDIYNEITNIANPDSINIQELND